MTSRHTRFAQAIEELLQKVSQAVFGGQLPEVPVDVVIAGGAAAHLYTGQRVSKDLDAEFLARLLKPEVLVLYVDESGVQRSVHLDRAYSTTLGVMHEDYLDRVQTPGWRAPGFRILVLAPVDLAISKLARWAEHDQRDVRGLVDAGLLHKDEFERLANEAHSYYVGNVAPVRTNLGEALSMFPRAAATRRPKP